SVPATSNIHSWARIRYLRRSTMSARVPANTASRTTGRVVADCTAATMKGEPVFSAMTQAAATSWIQVPTLPTSTASHIIRNVGWLNGDQAPGAVVACGAAAVFIAVSCTSVKGGRERVVASEGEA